MHKKQSLYFATLALAFLFSHSTFGMVTLTNSGSPPSNSSGGSRTLSVDPPAPVAAHAKKPNVAMSKLKQTVNRFRSTHQIAKENPSLQK